jgi:hypothetical protein
MNIGKLSPGDTLVCCSCNHERVIDQKWIDTVCEKYFFTRHPARIHDSDLWRFQCSNCRSKKLLKRTKPQAMLPATQAVADTSRYQFAIAYIDQSSDEEREVLYFWANQLMAIRASKMPALEKATSAIRVTLECGAIQPFIHFLGAEIKRIGWDERGMTARLALSAAAVAALTFSGQGAGIAALAGCGNTQRPSPRPIGVMRYQRSTSTI